MTTTDQPAPGLAEPRPRRTRELLILLGCLALIAVVVGFALGGSGGTSGRPQPVATGRPTSSIGGLSAAELQREKAVRLLLAQRSAAIIHHRRGQFAATLDPRHRAFRRQQLQMFSNLAKVSFSHWSYQFSATSTAAQEAQLSKYDVPAFAPESFTEHYAIAGFDPIPTVVAEYPTFVERSGHWYLTSFSDERAIHEVSGTQIWDYGPLDVVRRPHVLVLGPPSELPTMQSAAGVVEAAIPDVSAVWGTGWSRRAVVQVPSTQKEMAQITDDHGDLDQIAALTSSETSDQPSGPTPVGARITLNPAVWPRLGPLGVTAVLTHELTHVATRNDTGDNTPKWLSEGFADYVGYLRLGLSPAEIAPELAARVQQGEVPTRLPATGQFNGADPRISLAYEGGWMACRYIAAHYGQRHLVRFYKAVGASSFMPPRSVDDAMRAVLHLSPARFVAAWRAYLRAQL